MFEDTALQFPGKMRSCSPKNVPLCPAAPAPFEEKKWIRHINYRQGEPLPGTYAIKFPIFQICITTAKLVSFRETARNFPALTRDSYIFTAAKAIFTMNLQRTTVCQTFFVEGKSKLQNHWGGACTPIGSPLHIC